MHEFYFRSGWQIYPPYPVDIIDTGLEADVATLRIENKLVIYDYPPALALDIGHYTKFPCIWIKISKIYLKSLVQELITSLHNPRIDDNGIGKSHAACAP